MLIVEPDLPPRRTVYFVGAIVLRALRAQDEAIDLATLFRVLKTLDPNVPPEAVVPALDFLFLLGCVNLTDDGGLTCS